MLVRGAFNSASKRRFKPAVDISVGTIDVTVEQFSRLLGEERMKALTAPTSSHPFGLWWRKLIVDVHRTKARGAFSFAPTSLFLLDLYARLVDCSHDPSFDELLDRLLERSQFFSTLFETMIMSEYLVRGLPITIIPTGRQPGVRTPDFNVALEPVPVKIECKSLQDPAIPEAQILERLARRLLRQFKVHRRSWRLRISLNRYVVGGDEEPLFKECSEIINANFLGERTILDGARCSTAPINDLSAQTDLSFIHFEPGAFPDNPNIVRVAIVEFDRYFAGDATDRIQSSIEDAYGQLAKSGPNVLHIEIPYRTATRWLEVVDLAFNRTFGRLKNSYPRVSCLGITGRFVSTNAGGVPLIAQHALIPNPNTRSPLPQGFAVIGAEGVDPGLLNDEGTIFVEFSISDPMPRQVGRSLYHFSSADGARQIRLWQSFANHFRADFVHPNLGRRTFKGDLNHLAVGPFHRLALGFSREKMSAAINGDLLSPIENA